MHEAPPGCADRSKRQDFALRIAPLRRRMGNFPMGNRPGRLLAVNQRIDAILACALQPIGQERRITCSNAALGETHSCSTIAGTIKVSRNNRYNREASMPSALAVSATEARRSAAHQAAAASSAQDRVLASAAYPASRPEPVSPVEPPPQIPAAHPGA